MEKLLLSIILLIILILGVVFFWMPEYTDVINLRQNIKEKKVELQGKENYFSELNNLSLKLKEYGSELSKINSALPSWPGTSDLLHFLGKESSKNGLILGKLNLEKTLPIQEGSDILKTSLSFSASGSYSAFKNFLLALQNSARLIRVESVSFSAEKGAVFPFDFKIKTYSY